MDGTMRRRLRNSQLAGQAHIKTGTLKTYAPLPDLVEISMVMPGCCHYQPPATLGCCIDS